MSNPRIKAAFEDGKAFIPFVTCGDPSLEATKKIIAELAQAGAAVIELGISFSDPTAEGPVIQSANMRALEAGTTTDKVFDMVADLRKTHRYAFCVHDLRKRGVPLRHRRVLLSRSRGGCGWSHPSRCPL